MDFIRGEEVGHGSFGKVNLAIAKYQRAQVFPLMVVKSSAASSSATLLNENIILDELKSCPQIINCFGDSYSYENGEKLYNVLMEYASGGALSEKLKNSGKLSEFEVKKYTTELLRGVNYIHKNGYVHCDIKIQNILLSENDKIKIADFGLAKRAGPTNDNELRCELRGTPLYMSPEMVTRGEQGTPADIWALGCVVAEMATAKPVWNCLDITKLLMKIGVGDQLPKIPEKLSEEGKDFLRKCFVKDPLKRWTAEMLLNHPFIADQDYNQNTVTLKDEICDTPSTSPRCIFDFPNCVSDDDTTESTITCKITSVPSPGIQESLNLSGGSWSVTAAERLRGLVHELKPESEWSNADGWVNVR